MRVCPARRSGGRLGRVGPGAGRIFYPGVMFGLDRALHVIWHLNFFGCRVFIGDFTFYQN